MKQLVIIIYEIYDREFTGKLLLALKLISKNFCVLLIPNCSHGDCHYILRQISNIIPKDTIIIDKCMDAGNYIFLQKANILDKFKYISCDAEGLTFSSEQSLLPRDSRCYLPFAEKVTKVFTWGNKDYNFFKNKFSENNIDENKVVKTGYVAYDVCKKKYRDIYNNISVLKNNKIIVFLGWSYGAIMNMYKNYNISRFAEINGIEEKSVDNFISLNQKLNCLWNSLINKICEKYTDYIILFKPHPPTVINGSVKHTPSLKQLLKNPNFRIWNSENFIEPILLSSKCVIHCGSSCSLHSNLLDVENISFHPILEKTLGVSPFIIDNTITLKTATICKSVDETILKIDDILQNNYKLNISEEIKKNISNDFLINYEENTFAFENVIKEFINISNNSTSKNYFTNEELPIFINRIKEIPKIKWTWKTNNFNKKSVEDLISSFLNIDNEINISGYEIVDDFNSVFIY